ncbi:group 1 glycosyl transferase [Pandoraea sp. SD6-2]|nr:group 1 glycosyl transferase [Pandoraea sp. SD6-2]
MCQLFLGEISSEDILVFEAEGPVAESDVSNFGRARIAELARERFIKKLNPDALIITSLFEGFDDDAITSVGLLGDGPFTSVVLHDLIPYLNPDPDWPSHYKHYYDLKIASLKRADLLLSVSDYARRECAGAFPELGSRVVNISAACDDIFSPIEYERGELDALLKKFDIDRPFVMSVGSLERRKNLAQLVRAFGAMPEGLRRERLVVLVGSAESEKIEEMRRVASEAGLDPHQLRVLNHVGDGDLAGLYRACELFVFPSLHEGFGLPPLEAMVSGAVVLGANRASLPEVIGHDDAMFDPTSVPQLRDLMIRALTDQDFRTVLRRHGEKRSAAFSWDQTAQRAIHALELGVAYRNRCSTRYVPSTTVEAKPRLAVVSPVPPEKTGIADYVAELLPVLRKTYDITVISDQKFADCSVLGGDIEIRTVAWFEDNGAFFDRVVYQVGNSPFHAHMLDLMRRIPGVVVLHDFFISSLIFWMDESGYEKGAADKVLERSHGYGALEFLSNNGGHAAKLNWPCNYDIFLSSLGIIAHSDYCRELAHKFYGAEFARKVHVIPHHRTEASPKHRFDTRRQLGFDEDDFIVCSFGFMDCSKLNHTLLDAWHRSSLAGNPRCKLVFVGGKEGSDYGRYLDETIASIDGEERIQVTGFVERETFIEYLSIADCAVQLRAVSRGETSGTVLDCMAHGVPLIINAHGPMNDWPSDVLVKLADKFALDDLIDALERLWGDEVLRQQLAVRARAYVLEQHDPRKTAEEYARVIEEVVQSVSLQSMKQATLRFWGQFEKGPRALADDVAEKAADLIFEPVKRCLYLDVSATTRNDLRTGIERVARALLRELLVSPPPGFNVVPVALAEEAGRWRVRRARRYLASQEGYGLVPPLDDVVVPAQGDVLVALDLFPGGVIAADKCGLYRYWRECGATVGFMIHDLLPITHPEFFPPFADGTHQAWMEAVCASADVLVCISEDVRREVADWMAENLSGPAPLPRLLVSGHGADIMSSFATEGLSAEDEMILEFFAKRPTFLMVGTVEPRKGYLQVLEGFERLWRRGLDVNLVIVGSEGWRSVVSEDRGTIPETVERIRNCSELGRRLFWLQGISDQHLNRVYDVASCLIAASECEGYGLPLIEAAQHNLPIIARDIRVFRDLAEGGAFYFSGVLPEDVEVAVKGWLDMSADNLASDSQVIKWETWAQSAYRLGRLVTMEAHRH